MESWCNTTHKHQSTRKILADSDVQPRNAALITRLMILLLNSIIQFHSCVKWPSTDTFFFGGFDWEARAEQPVVLPGSPANCNSMLMRHGITLVLFDPLWLQHFPKGGLETIRHEQISPSCHLLSLLSVSQSFLQISPTPPQCRRPSGWLFANQMRDPLF